jgi:hypothetical protein
VSKPDLIELSTDWDTALRVADRYTGLGCGGDEYLLEQGARLLAGVLAIANQAGKGYRWISDILEGPSDPGCADLLESGALQHPPLPHAPRCRSRCPA